MRVNKENMRLWVAGLRSKKYQQTTGCLKRVDPENNVIGHCCLGVLCEVAMENGIMMSLGLRTTSSGHSVTFDQANGYLPHKVREWVGIGDTDPVLLDTGLTCIDANDANRWSYERIAQALETRYKLLEDDDEPEPVD